MATNAIYAHEVASKLTASHDLASIFKTMEHQATLVGSSLASLGELHVQSGVAILCPNGPEDYFRHYVAQRYDLVSPVVARMRSSLSPFIWSSVTVDRQANPLGYRCMAEAHDAGLVDALCVPVGHASGTLQGWVTFFTDRPQSLDKEARAKLHLLALIGHAQFTHMRSSDLQQALLSEAEQELLSALSSGTSSNDIALSYGLSQRTVEHHIRGASQKLGTATTMQTLAEAIRRRHLDHN